VSSTEELLETLAVDGDRRDPRLLYAAASVKARRLRRRRRLTLTAVPLALAVVAALVWIDGRTTQGPSSVNVEPGSAAATTSSTGATRTLPGPLQPSSVDPGGIVVSLIHDRSGTLLLQPLDGGAVRSIHLPDPNVRAIRTTGDATGLLAMVGATGSGQVWSYDQAALDGQTGPVLIGGAVDAYPGWEGDPTRITAVSVASGHYAVQDVGVRGESPGPPISVPDGFTPEGVVSGGIVLAGTTPSHQPTLEIWNPHDGAVVADLGSGHSPILMDAGGSTVAWRAADSDGHEVHVYDAASGRDAVVPVGDGVVGAEGDQPTITPDGSQLAFGLEALPQTFTVGMVNVNDHTLRTVASAMTPANYVWSTDHQWLIVDQGGLTAFNVDGTTSAHLAPASTTALADPVAVVSER
jgi:hypothetical protein